MSAGFGWSLSDVALLANATRKVLKALDEHNGAGADYQRVIKSLRDLESVLNEIRSILSKVDTVFGNALRGQLDLSTSSINIFYQKLISRYDTALSGKESTGRARSVSRKVSWAFTAAEELSCFRQQLSDQLNTVKFLIITHVWYGALQHLRV